MLPPLPNEGKSVRQVRLAYVALAVAILGWGSLTVAAKPVVPVLGAPLVALDRTLIAAIVLSIVCATRPGGARRLGIELTCRPLELLLLGVSSFFASALLVLIALTYISASLATILNNLAPLWLAVGTALSGNTRRPRLLASGSGLALAGVVAILSPGFVGSSALDWRGVLICLASSMVIAAQAVIGRRMMPGHDPLAVTAASAIVTVPPLVATVLATTGFTALVGVSGQTALLLAYLGVFCTATNFASFNFALKHLPATRASNITYLVPCVGVVLAVLILHERAGWNVVLGLAAAIVGIALAHRATAEGDKRRAKTLATIGADLRGGFRYRGAVARGGAAGPTRPPANGRASRRKPPADG